MATGTYSVELPVGIKEIWEFVSDMNKWAPLVPGYINHEILSENESTWEFKGDLGFMKKKVKLKIEITKWEEPTTVTFNLKGLSDNFKGGGYFEAEAIDADQTKMTGNLDITAGGAMAPMINSIMKTFVPKTAEELTIAVSEKIKEVAGVKS